MSRYPIPATARKFQFKDPTCDDQASSFAPKVEPQNDITLSSLARKVHFKESVCDHLKLPCASKVDSITCDDDFASLAEKVEDSICDDLKPSFASKVESKDIVCDKLDLAHADEVRDYYNPSFTVKQREDSMCNDLKLSIAQKDECKDLVSDDYNQSFAPKGEHKKERSENDPIPAVAAKVETKEKQWPSCMNPGNPIFSCMVKVPTSSYSPVPFVKPQNPLYRTTSAEYGSNDQTCETAPSVYKPLSQSFSAMIQRGGMYRNRSLNTGSDKNRVHDLLPF
ncbi:uncharacterized protein LOC119974164 [Scyliorhinus canicula]|uniref:uncharacterized protein LOC119974164 n=1 Tax=Scyliorhinus canicula TaxID=7830 RepID=UPI0018F3FCEB|nr:uncharacterized protein LOC119974164 [Scyliorhinus canicula]